MGQEKPLTPKDFKAIDAVLTEPTILLAAKKAGIGYSTLRKRIKSHLGFQAAVAEAGQKMREQMWQDASAHYHIPPPTTRRQ